MAHKGHKTGWSANGVLTTPTGPNSQPSDGAVHLQIDFGTQAAEYYTLEFNLLDLQNQNDPSGNNLLLRAKAEINWSVEGNFIRRLVHLSSGSSISGLGQSVSIKITDDSENPDSDPVVEYPVSVQVSRGTRPTLGGTQPPLYVPRPFLETSNDPTFRQPPYFVVPADAISMPVPADAGINSVYIMTQFTPNAVILPTDVLMIQLGTGITIAAGDLNSLNRFMPLVPGCNSIRVQNAHASSNLLVTPIWGVEG